MKNSKIHYGWVICFVEFCMMCFQMCIASTCLGVFVTPVCEDMGLTRSAFSLVSTFMALAGILLATQVGKFYKKYSIKKVLRITAITWPLFYALNAFAPNVYFFYVCYFCMGLSAIFGGTIAASTLISNWFTEKRGIAMSIYAAGTGIGGIFFNPFISGLILKFGFRKTYLIMACVMAAVSIPTSFLVKDRPEDMGLEPYGGKKETAAKASASGSADAEAIKKSFSFILMLAATLIVAIACNIFTTQTVAAVQDMGFDYSFAAKCASVLAAGLAANKFILGFMIDKIGSRLTTLFSTACFAVGCALMFVCSGSMVVLYGGIIMATVGMALYAVGFPVITEDIFGKENFSALFGLVTMTASMGGLIGGPAAAACYDAFGSYKPTYAALVALMCVCVFFYNLAYVKGRNR